MMTLADQIRSCGYAILEGVLGDREVAHYLGEVEALWRDECANNAAFSRRAPQLLVNNLPARTRAFDALVEHPEAVSIAEDLLEDECVLSELRACNLDRCDEIPFVHRDGYVRSAPEAPLAMLALWTLEPFRVGDGALFLYPGSHYWPFSPTPENRGWFRPLVVEAPPGSVVFFDANLWHGPSPNHSGASRWSLNAYYARWFMKPTFDIAPRFTRTAYQGLSPRLRRLYGFNSRPPVDERERLRTVVPIEDVERYFPFEEQP